jgi:hypothetical protein
LPRESRISRAPTASMNATVNSSVMGMCVDDSVVARRTV